MSWKLFIQIVLLMLGAAVLASWYQFYKTELQKDLITHNRGLRDGSLEDDRP